MPHVFRSPLSTVALAVTIALNVAFISVLLPASPASSPGRVPALGRGVEVASRARYSLASAGSGLPSFAQRGQNLQGRLNVNLASSALLQQQSAALTRGCSGRSWRRAQRPTSWRVNAGMEVEDGDKMFRGGPVDTTLPDRVLQLSMDLEPRLKGSAIYLVGMMGSGKTNIARILHNSLKYTFFDTDELVETITGKNVTSIFEESGEEMFRQIEEEVMQQLKPYTKIMVATGGGCVESMRNWEAMKNGLVVHLDAPTSVLAQRLSKHEVDKRPLLSLPEDATESALEDRLNEIYSKRREMYGRADIRIDLDSEACYEAGNVSPVKVAYNILTTIDRMLSEKEKKDDERKKFKPSVANINKPADIL